MPVFEVPSLTTAFLHRTVDMPFVANEPRDAVEEKIKTQYPLHFSPFEGHTVKSIVISATANGDDSRTDRGYNVIAQVTVDGVFTVSSEDAASAAEVAMIEFQEMGGEAYAAYILHSECRSIIEGWTIDPENTMLMFTGPALEVTQAKPEPAAAYGRG